MQHSVSFFCGAVLRTMRGLRVHAEELCHFFGQPEYQGDRVPIAARIYQALADAMPMPPRKAHVFPTWCLD